MYKQHELFLILVIGLVNNSLAFKALPFMTSKASLKNIISKQRQVSDEQAASFFGYWQGTCSAGDYSFPITILIDDNCPLATKIKINEQNYRIGHNVYSFNEGTNVIWEHARLNWALDGNKLTGSFIDIQENFADSDDHFSIFTKMILFLDNNKLIIHGAQNSLDEQDGNDPTQEKFSCSLEK